MNILNSIETIEKIAIISILFFSIASTAQADVVGKWKTVDDNTSETTSVIEIYTKDNRLFGKITKLYNEADEEAICTNCEGKNKNKPLIGLNILKNLKKTGNEYRWGKIFDPSNGKKYRCKIWLDENDKNKLHVRGYLGIFYRTQNWYRIAKATN